MIEAIEVRSKIIALSDAAANLLTNVPADSNVYNEVEGILEAAYQVLKTSGKYIANQEKNIEKLANCPCGIYPQIFPKHNNKENSISSPPILNC